MSIVVDEAVTGAGSIRIVLVDPHALVRAGLCALIEREPEMRVVGEAGTVQDALEVVSREAPDIILLDPNVDNANLDGILHLRAAAPQARLLLVTGLEDAKLYHRAVQLGAMGVVRKNQTGDTLIKAIRKVREGEAWLDRSMMAQVIEGLSGEWNAPQRQPEEALIELLSPRERQLVELVGKGFKNKQIAEQMSISEVTVRHHLTSIFAKLGVEDRLELFIFALKHGLGSLSG